MHSNNFGQIGAINREFTQIRLMSFKYNNLYLKGYRVYMHASYFTELVVEINSSGV
jgi:hypothetical protein